MNNSPLMKRFVSTEYLLMAVLVALFYVVLAQFAWWWLIILFPLFFITHLGYAVSPRIGAWVYNLGNNLLLPGGLLIVYIIFDEQWALFVSLIWLFHIFINRALGYGLRHTSSYHHTHLGKLTKPKKKPRR